MAGENEKPTQENNQGEADDFEKSFNEFAGASSDDDPPADQAGGDENKGDDTGQDDGSSAGNDDKQPADEAGKETTDGGNQPPAEATDIWANATPEQRKAFEALNAQYRALEHTDRSNRGRIAAFQRQLAELQASAPEKPAAGDKGKGGQNVTAQIFEAKPTLKKFKEEYPEVAEPIQELFSTILEENANLRRELSGLSSERRQDALSKNEQALTEKHPDWKAVTAKPEFSRWVEQQPGYVQQAIIRNAEHIVDPNEAADIIGRFKEATGQMTPPNPSPSDGGGKTSTTETRRKRQLEAASSVVNKGPGAGASAPDDFESAFTYFANRKRR